MVARDYKMDTSPRNRPQVQNCCVSEIRWLSLPKMLSGGNAFEISDPRRHRLDIQKRRLFSSRINEWYRRI